MFPTGHWPRGGQTYRLARVLRTMRRASRRTREPSVFTVATCKPSNDCASSGLGVCNYGGHWCQLTTYVTQTDIIAVTTCVNLASNVSSLTSGGVVLSWCQFWTIFVTCFASKFLLCQNLSMLVCQICRRLHVSIFYDEHTKTCLWYQWENLGKTCCQRLACQNFHNEHTLLLTLWWRNILLTFCRRLAPKL